MYIRLKAVSGIGLGLGLERVSGLFGEDFDLGISHMNVSMLDPALAIALGRLSQGCNHLEQELQNTLARLLPLTNEMGSVLFAGNQMRRNIEILRALLLLPEVAIAAEERSRLRTLLPRLVAINDHRSRFLHNPIVPGEGTTLHLMQERQNGKGGVAYPITTEMILGFAKEAEALNAELFTPHADYDLSKWGKGWRHFQPASYPSAAPPAHQPTGDQKQSDLKK